MTAPIKVPLFNLLCIKLENKMDFSDITDLYCNEKTCHKCLNDGYAWITTCSHIFCAEDGDRLFQNSPKCPSCAKELDAKSDLIRIKLNPSEQYRNMILCGQRPSVILQICHKAISFWFSQIKQENDYYKHLADRERDKRLQAEKNESDGDFINKQMQQTLDDLKKENEKLKSALCQAISCKTIKPSSNNKMIPQNHHDLVQFEKNFF